MSANRIFLTFETEKHSRKGMKIFLLSIVMLQFAYGAIAQQQPDDMGVLKLHEQYRKASEKVKSKSTVRFQKTYNPVKLILFIPLFAYQKVVSEQISASCSFEPSCSAFSILAIKKLGFIKGLFLTADRLTRCNGNAQPESEFYLYDARKSKVIDDPDMYRFKN